MSKLHPAHFVGASNNERPLGDLYETPAGATLALLKALSAAGRWDWLKTREVWEPACGRGAIATVLLYAGLHVLPTDIYDHGYADNISAGPADFFSDNVDKYANKCNMIITNPPYQVRQNGRRILTQHWIERAFEFSTIEDVFFLLKTTNLAGQERAALMERHLFHVYQFRGRVAMLRNGEPQQNMIDFAWMWFRRDCSIRSPTIGWIDVAEGE